MDRNRILTEINTTFCQLENERSKVQSKEKTHPATIKLMKLLKIQQIKTSAAIADKNHGLISNEKEQVKLKAKYFQGTFHKDAEPMPDFILTPMKILFTANEMKSVVRKLKNNQSPGKDEISAELIKSATDIIYKQIAKIYNSIAGTGEHPNGIAHDILKPLQKPGKLLLLSVLTKILAVCIMRRKVYSLDAEILPTQAAYRKYRSTTKHMFVAKMVIEQTISAKNETTHLLLLDMIQVFNSTSRKLLTKDLKTS